MSLRAPSIGAVVLRIRDPQVMTVSWSAALDHEVARLVALGACEVVLEHPEPLGRRLPEDPEGQPQGRHAAARRAGAGGCGLGFDVVQSRRGSDPR